MSDDGKNSRDKPLSTGDTVWMKKAHPCGGDRWEVVRTGSDIKLKCLTCGRLTIFSRGELYKKAKSIGRDI